MTSEAISPDWTSEPGASSDEIRRLVETIRHPLPLEYLELLAKGNGGEGALAVPPGWFQLFDIAFALQSWNDQFYRREYPDFFFFGSNGGLESFVVVLQGPKAGAVLAVDAIAGEDSAFQVARSFREFTQYVGRCTKGEA